MAQIKEYNQGIVQKVKVDRLMLRELFYRAVGIRLLLWSEGDFVVSQARA